MKIGVFDSGIGGKSVAKAIRDAFSEHEIVFRCDKPIHFPYATKSPEELLSYVIPVIATLVEDGCEVIVVACNTVSTTLIERLRKIFTVPLIAVEPMVKPACEKTKSKVIAVCATPTTLSSERYADLKYKFAKGVTVLEPDCSDWSLLIESSAMTESRLAQAIQPCLDQKADMVVLGCTHYHWIAQDIERFCKGRARVIYPEHAIISRLQTVIAQLA